MSTAISILLSESCCPIGAPFHVTTIKSPVSTPESPSSFTMGDDTPKLYYSKLSSDQRFLIFNEHDETNGS